MKQFKTEWYDTAKEKFPKSTRWCIGLEEGEENSFSRYVSPIRYTNGVWVDENNEKIASPIMWSYLVPPKKITKMDGWDQKFENAEEAANWFIGKTFGELIDYYGEYGFEYGELDDKGEIVYKPIPRNIIVLNAYVKKISWKERYELDYGEADDYIVLEYEIKGERWKLTKRIGNDIRSKTCIIDNKSEKLYE